MKTIIWLLPTDVVKNIPESCGEKYFPRRTERARRFLKDEDRLRCFAAGMLLCSVLGVREDDILKNKYGKPYVPDLPYHFNISHSGKYVIMARDDFEVGADIEEIDSAHISLAKSVCSDDEYAWVGENPLSRFFTVWTLKESVSKQLGQGLILSPKAFSVMPLISGEGLEIRGKTLYGYTTEYDGYKISVCREHPIDGVELNILGEKDLQITQ